MARAILVVEDDKLLGKAITKTLEAKEYQVFWARNAQEAFEALEAQEIGLIYLDIMLPGDIDGYEIIRRVRNNERLRNAVIIMLSNLGQMNEIDRAMKLGANDYLVKANIDLSKLVELTKLKILS